MTRSSRTRTQTGTSPVPVRRSRLNRDVRERLIVAEATRLFSEVGLDADLRELARRLNLTHPALFRYFPSKDALIERVYQDAFWGRWNSKWETIIRDRSISLLDRLSQLYKMYAAAALSYEWVRLYMFAALRGLDTHRRLYSFVADRIILPLCEEIRVEFGFPDFNEVPPHEVETELIWSFHSRVFYLGIRRHIYGMKLPENLDRIIDAEAETLLNGIGTTLRDVFAQESGKVHSANGTTLRRSSRRSTTQGVTQHRISRTTKPTSTP